MPRHVLIVDAVATNRIVLKVKLTTAFYEVDQVRAGAEAIQHAMSRKPAIVIVGSLDDMSAAALCKRLKSHPASAQIPVVYVSGNTDPALRLAVLRAGADDIIDKPCDDAVLLARLRSLQRARDTEAELQLRENTHRALGLAEVAQSEFEKTGLITVVTENRSAFAPRLRELRAMLPHKIELRDPRSFLRKSSDPRAREQGPDAFLLALSEAQIESELQMLPELRTREATRQAGVLVEIPEACRRMSATALDLGANDVVNTDMATEEIALRLDRLLRRKHKADRLRHTVRDGLRAAVTDPLTGLHNRRFAIPHLSRVAERARRSNRPFAVMVADLDYFKQINDTYGHAAGDAVLREVASRLQTNLRSVDLVARIGGEEFLVVLPDIRGRVAQRTAHRLCAAISERPFTIPGQAIPVRVTVSIGVTMALPQWPEAGKRADEAARVASLAIQPEVLLSRADQALYGAKAHGRNQVELSRPAA